MLTILKRLNALLSRRVMCAVTYIIMPSLFTFFCHFNPENGCQHSSNSGRSTFRQFKQGDPLESSVWCRGDSRTSRLCHFRNLCYSPDADEYVFFHGESTVVAGIPADGIGKLPVADLTSVAEMNPYHFTYTDLPANAARRLNISFVTDARQTALLLNRFKPDNLMHVLHDDILPAFVSVQETCFNTELEDCLKNVRLVMLDGHPPLHYFPLYELLSGEWPLLSEDLSNGTTYCFRNAVVGVSKETVWYDYGFKAPQGPSSRSVSGEILRTFARFAESQLSVESERCQVKFPELYVVLMLRASNRRILNMKEVMDAVSAKTGYRVVVLHSEDSDIKKTIELVVCSEGLIGMHGGSLVLALFLQKGRALVELFPYAVPPSQYTPYKILSNILGNEIHYGAWENKIAENTVTHPDWSPEYGGLRHLPQAERDRILKSNLVKPHLCCSDPEWLFRIYQDTVVDVQSFSQVLEDLFVEEQCDGCNVRKTRIPMYPGPVRNVQCHPATLDAGDNVTYVLSWDPPWNLQYLVPRNNCDHYEVWTQAIGSEHTESVITSSTNHAFGVRHFAAKYNCWISCKLNGKSSLNKWIACD